MQSEHPKVFCAGGDVKFFHSVMDYNLKSNNNPENLIKDFNKHKVDLNWKESIFA